MVIVDAWSGCPSPLLAWSFSYLVLDDLLRCRSVSHAWHSLLTAHPLSPLCYTSASLALPTHGSRWSTRMLANVFMSVPLLSALSFSPLDDSLAVIADTTVTTLPPPPPTNALSPVPLPATPPDPRTQHLHSVFLLHHLRVLILPLLTPSLSDVDLFGISAHLPLLEILTLQLPAASNSSHASTATSHSTSLTAVGFSHLSVMQHLAHLSITYHDTQIDRMSHEEGVRMDMIERQECWLAMMRCKSLRVMQLRREGRAMDEVEVWQQRRKERDEKEERRRKAESEKANKQPTSPPSPSDPTAAASAATTAGSTNGSTAVPVPATPASPSHNRRASLPIISSLHAMELHTQSLLSLPSSSSFSFSLFFSSFSASLLSFTFTSHPTHVADVLLYMDIEQAVLAALPTFQSLLHLNLTLCSFSHTNLAAFSTLSPRLLSFGLSRSLSMSSSVPLSPTAGGKLVPATSSWSTIEADGFVSFVSSCTRLASLRLHDIPFITGDSFGSLLAAAPNLHSLHLSLIPLPAAALRCLFDHPLLTYLEVAVDEEQWRGETSGAKGHTTDSKGEEEVAVWLEMGRRYKEWEKRWRLGRMGIGEEEEEDERDRRQQEYDEKRKKRRWLRDEMLAAGSWDEVLEEEFMNDTDDEDEQDEEQRAKKSTLASYRREVMSTWTELFYLQRLKDGDHVLQGRARRRWLAKQKLEQETRMRKEEEAWQRQQAKLEEDEMEAKGALVPLDGDGDELEQDIRLSDGELEDEPEDAVKSERRRDEHSARTIGSKRTSPVLTSQIEELVTSSHAEVGKEDWDVVPL